MMIFTEEFINSIKECKTSEEMSKKIKQVEELTDNLRKMRDCLEHKEINRFCKQMIQHNKSY